jgi:DNA-binding beta-propeller fold protein YncE
MGYVKLKAALCGSILCAVLWVGGCSSSSANVVAVTISPSSAGLVAGQSTGFTASVTGATVTTVTWTCSAVTTVTNPQTGKVTTTTTTCTGTGTPQFGTYTISSSSLVLTYTAPPLSSFPNPVPSITLTATADADKGKTGTATVGLDSGIRVSVTPTSATVPVGLNPPQTQKFSASLLNTSDLMLNWILVQPDTSSTIVVNQSANPMAAPCTTCGSIDANGIYTPPSTVPTTTTPSGSTTNPQIVYAVVNSVLDPNHYAVATINLVNATTNPITFTGIYPSMIAAGGTVQDIFLNAHNFLNTTPITFTNPKGNALPFDPSTQIFTTPVSLEYCTTDTTSTPEVTCDVSIMTRVRMNATQLAVPGTGSISATIPDPNNAGQNVTISFPITLTPARPGLVAAVPDSFPSGQSGSTTFSINGGYYGGGLVNFALNNNAGVVNATTSTSRQINASVLSGLIPNPGLYPLSVTSNATTNPPMFPSAYTNVAVQPLFTNAFAPPPALLLHGGASAYPSSIVVNSNHKYALVTELGTDTLDVYDISTGQPVFSSSATLSCKNATPCQPTNVAYTETLVAGQDTAVVLNSTGQSLALVGICTVSFCGHASATVNPNYIDLSNLVPNTTDQTPGSTPPLPYSVGVDPGTNYAVVAFSSSNLGFIVDLNTYGATQTPPRACFVPTITAPPCIVSSVSLTTGTNPQIVLQPDVPLAYVSPGGNGGVSSLVNLLQQNDTVQIAPASNTVTTGATRTANVVTIITTTPHGINNSLGGSVLISNASPMDLNGAYQVNPGSVLDLYTFSYTQTPPPGQTLANVTNGGGGTVQYGSPYYPFQTSSTTSGLAINPITRNLAFADFNSQTSQIQFINTLDQSLSSLTLSVGTCNTCTPTTTAPELGFRSVAFDPYTNVLIAFNPNESYNQISLINPGGLAAVGTQASYRIAPPIGTNQVGNGTFTPASGTAVPVYGSMAYDPVTNLAIAANAGSGTLSYLNINPSGSQTVPFKSVEISGILVTSGGVPNGQPPLGSTIQATCIPQPTLPPQPVPYSSCFPESVTLGQPATVRIFGKGFKSGGTPIVRLDASVVGVTTTALTDTEVDATIAASVFTVPHDFALDVVSGTESSNVTELHAVGVSPVPACAGTAAQPEGVAIDDVHHIAVFTNYACNTMTIMAVNPAGYMLDNGSLAPFGAVLSTISVGAGPLGVALIPRLGYAVTANSKAGPPGTATIVNISDPENPKIAVTPDVAVGVGPTGVAIDQDHAFVLVANGGDVTLSVIDLTVLLPGAVTTTVPTATTVAVSGPPTAIAVDPNRGVAVVTTLLNSGTTAVSGGLDTINLTVFPPVRISSASISSLTANPTGITYDPAVSPAVFYATSTLQNAIYSFDPDTGTVTSIAVGTKPYSVAYNYQTGGMLAVNSTSQTSSVVDTQTFRTRETLGISSQSIFSTAVDTVTNIAVIVDQNNNRVLMLAIPK